MSSLVHKKSRDEQYKVLDMIDGPSVSDSVSVSLIGRSGHRGTSLFFCMHIRLRIRFDRPSVFDRVAIKMRIGP